MRKWYRLKDIADSQTGPFGSQLHEEDYVKEGTPIVTVEHLGDIGFIHANLPMVSDDDKMRLSKYTLIEGDIVFSRVGSVDRSTYVNIEEEGWLFSGRCIRVRCKSEKVNSRYLSFYFKQRYFKKMMKDIAVGATMPSLNTSLMDDLKIYLPNVNTQQKIASVLSFLSKKIELNNRIIAELEAMEKQLYDYWFVQFDFPNAEGKPYRSSGGRMVYYETLKREIPEGWEVKNLDEVSTIIGGSTPSTENPLFFDKTGTSWITPKDLSENKVYKYIEFGQTNISELGVKAASLKLMPRGTVLMSSRAPVGYLAVATTNVTSNQGLKSFVPNKGYNSDFLFYTIHRIMPIIESKASGSTFKEVGASDLKRILWYFPPTTLSDKFAETLGSASLRQEGLQKEIRRLAELRDWLLPMLMNGQVRVE